MVDTGTKTGKAAFAAALAAVVIGAGVLAGWLFEVEFLKRIASGLVAMNPATAIAFILAGTSLALFLQSPRGRDQKSRALILTARLCALVVALIGLGKLAGILCGWDLGVDRWLFASKLPDGLQFPNRMAPNAALNFLLLGGALLLVDVKNRSVRFCVEFSVVVVGFVSLLAVLGHVYNVQSFYRLGDSIPMALHTVITFSILSVAFLLSHTDSGLLAVFAGDSAGGTMARRLLPAAVLVPAGLGWLTLQGAQAEIYSGEIGQAVFAVANILVFTFLVCWSAKGLFSADLGRKKDEEALRESAAFLEAQVNSSIDGILVVSQEGKQSFQNQRFVDLLKIPQSIADEKADENRLQWVTDMTKNPERFAERVRYLYDHPAETSRDEIELKDGTILDRYSSPVVGKDGKYYGRIWTFRDITERKQAEEAQARLVAILETTPDLVSIADLEGRLVYVNRAGQTMLGIDELADLTRYNLQEFHDAANAHVVLTEGIPTAMRDGAWSGETELVALDGHATAVSQVILAHKAPNGTVTFLSTIARDITERKQAEALLMENRQRLALATESAHIGIWDWDVVANKLVWDTQMYELYGFREPDFGGAYDVWQKGLHPEDRDRGDAAIHAALDGVKDFHIEFRVVWPDGEVRHIEAHAVVQRAGDGSATHMIGVNWDITDRKQLEAQLFQSQKMETVGKLAGGIAHEFNSILTAIIGQSELLLGDLPAGSPMAKSATEISKAAGRAATLTRQLLAYGRKQLLQPETLDLNHVLTGMEVMLHHLMSGGVDMQIVPAPGLQPVKADAGQIEQVIMNIAINASEAMPNGGKLTLETANVSFDQESVGRYPELKPGDYVMLAITDTGTGMSEKVKARLFEPFFSTKGLGQGTGLGLSTCYGIIKQSGGHISVYSEPARGSTFKIYLPQVEQAAKISMPRLDSPGLPRGMETILLVEDDSALLEMAATLLRRLGYTVLVAANGIEALSLKHQRDIGHIDLLFTDVVMPHMSGKELADRVRALYPHTRILFTSAYTENAIVHQGVLDKGVALLQKPFTPSALAYKLREALDAATSPSVTSSELPQPVVRS